MNLINYSWADSDLERIQVEYDQAVLTVWNDAIQKRVLIKCSGLAGITNLCIWDDTIILDANLYTVVDINNDFLCQLYGAYDKNYDYGGKVLNKGLLELKITLSNNIAFSVYCLEIDVVEHY